MLGVTVGPGGYSPERGKISRIFIIPNITDLQQVSRMTS
jgi:hypothetical protein